MKKILSLVLFIPIFGMSQNQTVINASRYFPKADKVMEFEKALVAHIQKFHSGDWKWRVYEIQTGPDAGGYEVIEGPKTWDEFDKRETLAPIIRMTGTKMLPSILQISILRGTVNSVKISAPHSYWHIQIRSSLRMYCPRSV